MNFYITPIKSMKGGGGRNVDQNIIVQGEILMYEHFEDLSYSEDDSIENGQSVWVSPFGENLAMF